MIYLDHAATAPVPRAVADAMYQVLTEQYGNPSSQYPFGSEMKKRAESWRQAVAALLDCPADRLFFTSCGTEGDNWALRAAVWQNRHVGNHIVTTAVEHSAVLECCKWLEREGCEVTYLAPDQNGSLTAEQVLEAVRPDTAAVSVMLVNNELGTVYPVADIARGLAARNPKTLLHTDAVQGLGTFSARALGAGFRPQDRRAQGRRGPVHRPPGAESPAPSGGRGAGAGAPLRHRGHGPDRGLCQGGGAAPGGPGAEPGPFGGPSRRSPGEAACHTGHGLRGGGDGPSHSAAVPGGLARRKHRQRPGKPGNLHFRRVRLPPGQAQPCRCRPEAPQAGGRRGDPPQLWTRHHRGGHRRLCPGSPAAPGHPDAHAVNL